MSSSKDNDICVCGRKRHTMNIANWKRHLNSCKINKSKRYCPNITSFFTASNSASKKHQLDYNSKDEFIGKKRITGKCIHNFYNK